MHSLTPREQAHKLKLFRQQWYCCTQDEAESAQRINKQLSKREFKARLQRLQLKEANKISH